MKWLVMCLIFVFNVYAAMPPFPFIIEPLEEEYAIKEVPEEVEKKEVKEDAEEIKVKEFTTEKSKGEEVEKQALFSIPDNLRREVEFWISVYTKYNSWDIIIHDSEYPGLVYEVVEVKDIMESNLSYRRKLRKVNRIINERKKYYRDLLYKIQNYEQADKVKDLNAEEQALREKFKNIEEKNKYKKATWRKRMRMQFGQADRFKEGIKISGRYMPYLEAIFNEYKLQVDLTRLVFVESMFNVKAYSKVGASGIWQFMRYTGKKYLEISYAVDERRDPIEATVAAAKLLKHNFELLGHWPLAITAYNHGVAGMNRAVRKIGSTNIREIIDNYKSRTFGFASKNFYVCFLAALEVERNSEKYFGEIVKDSIIKFKEFVIPHFLSFQAIQEHFNISLEDIRELNPALKNEVYEGHARVPQGYRFRVPPDKLGPIVEIYDKIPNKYKHSAQKRRKYYRVRRGDSLWTIARRYRTSLKNLMRINGIFNGRSLRAGQVLVIP